MPPEESAYGAYTPDFAGNANAMLLERAIEEFPDDALCIAFATVASIDFEATWNIKHINNPFTKNLSKR